MRTWLRRLAYLLQQSRHEAELCEEIETHRALRVAQLKREGLTILLVTHDPRVAERADRIVSLADGRIVSDVTPVLTTV